MTKATRALASGEPARSNVGAVEANVLRRRRAVGLELGALGVIGMGHGVLQVGEQLLVQLQNLGNVVLDRCARLTRERWYGRQ